MELKHWDSERKNKLPYHHLIYTKQLSFIAKIIKSHNVYCFMSSVNAICQSIVLFCHKISSFPHTPAKVRRNTKVKIGHLLFYHWTVQIYFVSIILLSYFLFKVFALEQISSRLKPSSCTRIIIEIGTEEACTKSEFWF